MKLLRSTTTSRVSALLLYGALSTECLIADSAQVHPSIPGVGVVVKHYPNRGSRVTNGKDGSGSVKLTQGSYSISLEKATLLRVGEALVKQADAKSTYSFNGDGTQIAVTPDKDIAIAAGKDKGLEDVVNITVNSDKATLKFTVTWNSAVMKQGEGAPGYIGHVTLLK